MPLWTAAILTLFPEMFPGVLGASLAEKAKDKGLWNLEIYNIRDFTTDKHHTVDDTPYGGGAGMVFKPDVVANALDAILEQHPERKTWPKVYLSPRGTPLNQVTVNTFAAKPGIILLCGRYEGVDQRVLEAYEMTEVSLGDYILAGGEVAAQVVCEAVVRLLPGAVGDPATHTEESFSSGLLEYPHYTKPPVWRGVEVPAVLRGGNHAAIAAWRHRQAEDITLARRPDLWRRWQEKK
ncbi:MAG: tRNA (guanosine(37)-N1)-methyltransferase TrmD [Holosporales bacterium]|jgi:tRNA (guanine37-N1)-methyltransferase